jgi:cytoplasmic tRNA 2-thiolation protein 2
MEAFRTRHTAAGDEPKLLLPMSFGVSSLTLLHILDKQLRSQQQKTGRTGFSLHILHVLGPGDKDFSDTTENMRKEYREHQHSTMELTDLFAKPSDLTTLLNQLPSATSRADVLAILRMRRLVQFAKENNCEGILFGHTTTALAERILSTTAMGRGFSLPWQVLDGPSLFGIPLYYPMRDVLRKELIPHAKICEPSLVRLIDPAAWQGTVAPPSKKDTSIQALMGAYFEEVEEGYPSVVSNVVRTAGKLDVPVVKEGDVVCRLCGMSVEVARMGIEGCGGHQGEIEKGDGRGLCYGCERSLPGDLVGLLP